MRRGIHVHASLVLALAGCGAPSTADWLTLRFVTEGGPFAIDTLCDNGGCEADSALWASVAYDEAGGVVPDASVELLQYRVDYVVEGLAEPVPYLAGGLAVRVLAGAETSFALVLAAYRQREHLLEHLGQEAVEGRASVTLEGYDAGDLLVRLRAELAITAGDLVTGGGAP